MMTNPSYTLVLASASPRRRELLTTSGITPVIHPSRIEEVRHSDESPLAYCERLAKEKAQFVATDISESKCLILAADTVVYVENDIYEKPFDEKDAFQMLLTLSKGWHHVVSAWYLCSAEQRFIRSGYRISDVRFRELQENEIWTYVNTREGFDKAGSYGIQGLGAALVQEIRGSYSNIVGLPLADVLKAIREYQH